MKKLIFVWLVLGVCRAVFAAQQIPAVYANNQLTHRFASSSDTTLPTQIVSQKDIQQSGAVNLSQVLSFAGLQVHTLGGLGSNVTVNFRGFGGNAGQNTLILLNGHPLMNPDLGTYNFNTIPLSLVKKIKIYSGSAGVLYGDQAVGGVINIITRPIAKKSQYLQAGTGSFHTWTQQAGISRHFSRQYTARADIYHVSTNNYRKHNDYRSTYVDLAGDKRFAHGRLDAEYQVNPVDLQYPGALTLAQVKTNRRQAEAANDHDRRTNQTLTLDYKQNMNASWQAKVETLLSQMNRDGRLTNDYNAHRYDINIAPSLQGLLKLGHVELMPTLGVQFNQGQYHFDSDVYNSKARQMTVSEFMHVNVPIWKRGSMFAGLRYAQAKTSLNPMFARNTQTYNDAFVTDLGLSWQINQVWRVYLRRAGSYRFPKTDEDINTDTGRPLKTQTGVSYETGVVWQAAKWSGLFDLYQLDLDNEITSIPIPNSATTFAQNQNLAPTARTGFSINTSYHVIKPVTLQGIYRYVNARFHSGPDKGNRIPFVADNTLTFNVIFQFLSRWSVALGNDYIGKRTFADDPEERTRLLGGYTLTNLNLRYHWRWLTADFKINNVTNKQYYDYALDVYQGSQAMSYYYPAAGRSFFLNVSVRL